MVTFDALNAHVTYPDVVRHWSPVSEKYAGGDQLVTLLNEGWQIKETIFCETIWHAGTRPVEIYHMDVVRGDEAMPVPVIANPYVRRIILTMPFHMRAIDEHDAALRYR